MKRSRLESPGIWPIASPPRCALTWTKKMADQLIFYIPKYTSPMDPMGFFVCQQNGTFPEQFFVFETCRRQNQTSVTWWWMLELQVARGTATPHDTHEWCWGGHPEKLLLWHNTNGKANTNSKTSRTFWLPCLHMNTTPHPLSLEWDSPYSLRPLEWNGGDAEINMRHEQLISTMTLPF